MPAELLPLDNETECDGCGFVGAQLRSYGRGFPIPTKPAALCDICAGTPCGNAQEYPDQYRHISPVLITIAYAANTILAELRKKA